MIDRTEFQLRSIAKEIRDLNHTLVKTNTLLYEMVRLQTKAAKIDEKEDLDE